MTKGVVYVRELCAERGVKVSQLEKDLGFSNGYLNPKKQSAIPHDRAERIAKYFGTTDVERIEGDKKRKNNVVQVFHAKNAPIFPIRLDVKKLTEDRRKMRAEEDELFQKLIDDYVANQMESYLSEDEKTLLDGFEDMNQEGQQKLLSYLNDLLNSGLYLEEPVVNAAHERTDTEISEEDRAHDEAIMDDDNF